MKLIIQIPCFNEAQTLPLTLSQLPRKLAGFKTVEWLVIDDGSSDRTSEVAKSLGVDHIVRFTRNQGLARAFMAGIHASLRLGADVIVNTDADNQYRAEDISELLKPILRHQADIVIGARPINHISHFSLQKKIFQKIGSWMIRLLSHTEVRDAPSGFRALKRDAAMQLNVFNQYTYTLEMIIQAGAKNLSVVSVPVRVNKDLRPSRLFSSIYAYMQRSLVVMLRVITIYKPFSVFSTLGAIFFLAGVGLGVRWLIIFFSGTSRTHVPSLILTSILIMMGFFLGVLAILADLISVNRQILEENQYRLRVIESELHQNDRKKKKKHG